MTVPRRWTSADREPTEHHLRLKPENPKKAGGPWRRERDGLWHCYCGESCCDPPSRWPWVDLIAVDEPMVEFIERCEED